MTYVFKNILKEVICTEYYIICTRVKVKRKQKYLERNINILFNTLCYKDNLYFVQFLNCNY